MPRSFAFLNFSTRILSRHSSSAKDVCASARVPQQGKSRSFNRLRTLELSCASFCDSCPLFSRACTLFCKNRGWYLRDNSSSRGLIAFASRFSGLCFHILTNCFFRKRFVFTTIRIARGCGVRPSVSHARCLVFLWASGLVSKRKGCRLFRASALSVPSVVNFFALRPDTKRRAIRRWLGCVRAARGLDCIAARFAARSVVS